MLLLEGAPISPDSDDEGKYLGLRGWYSIQVCLLPPDVILSAAKDLCAHRARCFAAPSLRSGLRLTQHDSYNSGQSSSGPLTEEVFSPNVCWTPLKDDSSGDI